MMSQYTKLVAGRQCCCNYHVQGIYGCAKPHQLQGLMGPSGAGKSTLMDLLAMRTPHDAAAPTAAELAAAAVTTPTVAAAGVRAADVFGDPTGAAGGGSVTAAVDGSLKAGSRSRSQLGQPPPQLLVNGIRMQQQAYMNISAYVPQVCQCFLTCMNLF